MALKDPLSMFNRKTVGYGKSGTSPYTKDDEHSLSHGTEDMIRRFNAVSKYSLETSNLSKENIETIMGVIGDIVGRKERYSKLDRRDEMEFRHRIEQEFYKGNLTRPDIEDAKKIWDNFKE